MRTNLPTGFTDQHDYTTWNTGYVFLWSKVLKGWIDCDVRLSIVPGMTIQYAFEEEFDCPMCDDHAVFFVCADCTDRDYCDDCRGWANCADCEYCEG